MDDQQRHPGLYQDMSKPDIDTVPGSAAAPFFNLQSPLGADALKMPTMVSTRCSTVRHAMCSEAARGDKTSPGIGERVSMTTYRSPLSRQAETCARLKCPYEHLAVALAGDIGE